MPSLNLCVACGHSESIHRQHWETAPTGPCRAAIEWTAATSITRCTCDTYVPGVDESAQAGVGRITLEFECGHDRTENGDISGGNIRQYRNKKRCRECNNTHLVRVLNAGVFAKPEPVEPKAIRQGDRLVLRTQTGRWWIKCMVCSGELRSPPQDDRSATYSWWDEHITRESHLEAKKTRDLMARLSDSIENANTKTSRSHE